MKLVVVYDKDLATQCFRRNLRQLIRPGICSVSGISEQEIDYFSERLAETCVFSVDERLGNPWVFPDTQEIKGLSRQRLTLAQSQKCELLANELLIFEGVVRRVGAFPATTPEQNELRSKKLEASQVLYLKASGGSFRTELEKTVLTDMAHHATDWIRYLTHLPGNDYMDLLSMS